MHKQPSQQIEFYTKIQEAIPSHLSTLPNKQVGYYVHVQSDKLYKLKNCIDSARTNSELYKKFSKKFSANLKKNMNQLFVCCGLQEQARLQTSLGLKKNPGIFMIVGIGVLDEKYQQDHKNYDVEISFLQYNEGKLFDLLRHTGDPLKMHKKNQEISFGESYFKITTFSQFLKLFKIALFNNKQRDLKTDCRPQGSKIKSSFIMIIHTKIYTTDEVKTKKTVLIDFAMDQLISNQKNEWEYFTIQLNNLTNRKKQHYHLVEPNPLINLINCYLKTGETYILNSMSANPHKFQKNIQFILEFEALVSQILQRPETHKPQNYNKVEISLRQDLTTQINSLVSMISNKKYTSLREYRQLKQKVLDTLTLSKNCMNGFSKYCMKLLQNKRKIRLAEHFLIADQIRLIGSCVKTDNYKDFYRAKSYLSLQRQVQIKTQETKKLLKTLTKETQMLYGGFHQSKSHFEVNLSSENYLVNINTNFQQTNKLHITKHSTMKIGINFVEDINQTLKSIIKKTFDLEMKIFQNIIFESTRTNADEIIRQEMLINSAKILQQEIDNVKLRLGQLARTGKLEFELDCNNKDPHLTLLIRQIQKLTKDDSNGKRNSHKYSKISNNNRKKLLDQRNTLADTSSASQTKFTKLPLIQTKNICITGNISLKQMLLDPTAYL